MFILAQLDLLLRSHEHLSSVARWTLTPSRWRRTTRAQRLRAQVYPHAPAAAAPLPRC